RVRPSSSRAPTSVPRLMRATWSLSAAAMMRRLMTACHWLLPTRRRCRARRMTPPPPPSKDTSAAASGMDAELFRILSKAVEELDLEWSPPEEPSR
ncbi:hypothetical protein QQF64_022105, partial [Cirrhinus molitorella]